MTIKEEDSIMRSPRKLRGSVGSSFKAAHEKAVEQVKENKEYTVQKNTGWKLVPVKATVGMLINYVDKIPQELKDLLIDSPSLAYIYNRMVLLAEEPNDIAFMEHWKLVPLEPTYKMVNDDNATDPPDYNGGFLSSKVMRAIYQHMLEVAPKPTEHELNQALNKSAVVSKANRAIQNKSPQSSLIEELLALVHKQQEMIKSQLM